MKTKTITLYQFDELPAAGKAKAIENHRYINVDYGGWADCTLDEWKEKLTAFGYVNPKIQYSGFSSQGDGASFTCKVIDLPVLIKAQKDSREFAAVLRRLKSGKLEIEAEIMRTSNRYCHKYTVNARVNWYMEDNHRDTPALDAQLAQLESYTNDHARGLMTEIYRDLESGYDDLTSDESVIDTLTANEYYFTAQGELTSPE